MQQNSDTGILEGLPDDVWDGIMQDTEPERFRFNEDAKTLDELLPDELKSGETAKGQLQLIPGVHKTDGFFLAKFRKTEEGRA